MLRFGDSVSRQGPHTSPPALFVNVFPSDGAVKSVDQGGWLTMMTPQLAELLIVELRMAGPMSLENLTAPAAKSTPPAKSTIT